MSDPHGPAPSRKTRAAIAVIVIVVVAAFVIAHLTGVVGPGTH